MDNFTKEEILAKINEGKIPQIWVEKCVGIMSMIGSFLVILHVWKAKKYDTGTYLVTLMCVSDFMSSLFAFVIGTLMVPSGLIYGARGNRTTCIVQGVFVSFFTCLSPLINAVLALYFLFIVKHQWRKERFESFCNRFWFFIFPILIAFIMSIVPLIGGGISYSLGRSCCNIENHPPGCSVNKEVFGECKSLIIPNIVDGFRLLLLFPVFMTIAVSMTKLWVFVRKTQHNSGRHTFVASEVIQDRNSLPSEQNLKLIHIGTVGILYSVSYFLTYIFYLLERVFGGIPVLAYLSTIFLPAQGVLNALVYFYRVHPNIHKKIILWWYLAAHCVKEKKKKSSNINEREENDSSISIKSNTNVDT